jgi:hypothetical protein
MLEIDKKKFFFKKKNIWFSNYPFDIPEVDVVYFYACKEKVDKENFNRKESPTLVIDLGQNLDEIWKNMGKKSCRYFIKRGQKLGIEIRLNQEIEATPENIDYLKRHGKLFTAHLNGELLSGALMLEDSEHIRWFYGASKRLEKGTNDISIVSFANRLAIWEAIKYAKAKGLKEFDLGGYYTGNNENDPRVGINRFKEKFGGVLTIYYTYWKYYSKLYMVIQRIYSLTPGFRKNHQ